MLTTGGRSHNPSRHASGVESVTAANRTFRRLAIVTAPQPPLRTVRGPGPEPGLRLAACLVAVEGLTLLIIAGVELFSLDGSRVGLGVTTAVFFAACGCGLGWAAAGLWRARSWSRGPVVAAQLLVLGVAWSSRSAPWLALLLVGWGLAVLVLVLRPAATDALAD